MTESNSMQVLMLTNQARIGAIRDDTANVMRPVTLGPSLWASLVPVVTTSESGAGYPLADTRNGSLFKDGGDETIAWYLPEYVLNEPDLAFSFAAAQDGADSQGRPFNRASIRVGLKAEIPADVQAARTANPNGQFSEIPIRSFGASLILHSNEQDGSDRRTAIPGRVETSDAGLTLIFDGLLGPDVLIAFADLTATGRSELELQYSYDTVRWVQVPIAEDPGRTPPILVKVPVQDVPILVTKIPSPTTTPIPIKVSPVATRAMARAAEVPVIDRPISRGGPVSSPRTRRVAVHESVSESVTRPIGTTYANQSYRPRYTVTQAGVTRGIVNAQDLQEFDVNQSEYIELTALGDVATRYPSLRALYFGQVSGAVIAIPAAYGVLRTHAGCAAECDAVLDPTPTSPDGCRFHLSFTLGPLVDPGDLARLAADLATAPTLSGRSVHLALPTDLDRRIPSTLQSGSITSLTYGVGISPNTFLLSLDIVDDDVPAVVKASLFLAQLTSTTTTTLIGRMAVRLDDAYETPVTADVVLNLHSTAGSDDITLAIDENGAASVTNLSPLDLTMLSSTVHTSTGFVSSPLNRALNAGQAVPLALPAGADQALVECALNLPDPLPAGAIEGYVTIHTENVQRIHHAIGFNAIGQLAPAVSKVSITMALDGAPDIALPTIELTPAHAIDNTAIEVPVASALTGLATTLALTVSHVDGSADYLATLKHDFLAHPIMTLTSDQLTAPA